MPARIIPKIGNGGNHKRVGALVAQAVAASFVDAGPKEGVRNLGKGSGDRVRP